MFGLRCPDGSVLLLNDQPKTIGRKMGRGVKPLAQISRKHVNIRSVDSGVEVCVLGSNGAFFSEKEGAVASVTRVLRAGQTFALFADTGEFTVIPPCKYGAQCYRKNEQHLSSEAHPPPGAAPPPSKRTAHAPKRKRAGTPEMDADPKVTRLSRQEKQKQPNEPKQTKRRAGTPEMDPGPQRQATRQQKRPREQRAGTPEMDQPSTSKPKKQQTKNVRDPPAKRNGEPKKKKFSFFESSSEDELLDSADAWKKEIHIKAPVDMSEKTIVTKKAKQRITFDASALDVTDLRAQKSVTIATPPRAASKPAKVQNELYQATLARVAMPALSTCLGADPTRAAKVMCEAINEYIEAHPDHEMTIVLVSTDNRILHEVKNLITESGRVDVEEYTDMMSYLESCDPAKRPSYVITECNSRGKPIGGSCTWPVANAFRKDMPLRAHLQAQVQSTLDVGAAVCVGPIAKETFNADTVDKLSGVQFFIPTNAPNFIEKYSDYIAEWEGEDNGADLLKESYKNALQAFHNAHFEGSWKKSKA